MAMQRARVSGRDVAGVAGVSLNTVSLVVRDSALVAPATKARVQEVIDRLGYQPHAAAAALASARSHTVGYLRQGGDAYEPDTDEKLATIDVFHNQLLNAITARARAQDYYVLLDSFDDAQRCLSLVRNARIDGALIDHGVEDALLAQLVARDAPIVLVGRDAGDLAVSWVKADEEGGAYAATRHLLDQGHACLALLTVDDAHDSAIVGERVRGYQRALAEAGLPVMDMPISRGDYTFESGHAQGLALLTARPRPTGLFVLSEVMAGGALLAAQELGLDVPDDLSIVTTENSPFVEYVRPRLSAVHVPMYEVGVRATDLLFALLDDPTAAPRQLVLPTTFVARDSCARPPVPASTH